MQGYLNNFPIFTYNPVVSSGIVSGSNLFLNVWFSKQYPGNPTPYAAATSASNLVTMDSTGSYITLTRANWVVKAYLLYASTWA